MTKANVIMYIAIGAFVIIFTLIIATFCLGKEEVKNYKLAFAGIVIIAIIAAIAFICLPLL